MNKSCSRPYERHLTQDYLKKGVDLARVLRGCNSLCWLAEGENCIHQIPQQSKIQKLELLSSNFDKPLLNNFTNSRWNKLYNLLMLWVKLYILLVVFLFLGPYWWNIKLKIVFSKCDLYSVFSLLPSLPYDIIFGKVIN